MPCRDWQFGGSGKEGDKITVFGNLPVLQNFQVRRLLRQFVRAGMISKEGERNILESLDSIGARFPLFEIRVLENTLMEQLGEGKGAGLAKRVWALRGRFVRGHSMAASCLRLDCYADEIPNGATVKMIHAFLLALAETETI